MSPLRILLTGAVLCVLLDCSKNGPGKNYTLEPEESHSFAAHGIEIQQFYDSVSKNPYGWPWQTWVKVNGKISLLKPDGFVWPAGYKPTTDGVWLVRTQKTGSGCSTVFLYHRKGKTFVPASSFSLGDLAWKFFKAQGHSLPDYHDAVYLLKGIEQNFAPLGVHWPPNRYIALGIGGNFDNKGWIEGWHFAYDLQTGQFFVPKEFEDGNSKAIVKP